MASQVPAVHRCAVTVRHQFALALHGSQPLDYDEVIRRLLQSPVNDAPQIGMNTLEIAKAALAVTSHCPTPLRISAFMSSRISASIALVS